MSNSISTIAIQVWLTENNLKGKFGGQILMLNGQEIGTFSGKHDGNGYVEFVNYKIGDAELTESKSWDFIGALDKLVYKALEFQPTLNRRSSRETAFENLCDIAWEYISDKVVHDETKHHLSGAHELLAESACGLAKEEIRLFAEKFGESKFDVESEVYSRFIEDWLPNFRLVNKFAQAN